MDFKMEYQIWQVNYDFWKLTADRMLKLDTGSSNMDTENLTLNTLIWKQSPWNRTLALKQNAECLNSHPERLNSHPERLNEDPARLTDPKRFNIDA